MVMVVPPVLNGLALPARMSFTIPVPASVPSLTHNSRPWILSSATKKALSPTTTAGLGSEPPVVRLMSATSDGSAVVTEAPASRHRSSSGSNVATARGDDDAGPVRVK
jgi:hypothetical protein